MIDLGEYDARKTIVKTDEEKEQIFKRTRQRLEKLIVCDALEALGFSATQATLIVYGIRKS